MSTIEIEFFKDPHPSLGLTPGYYKISNLRGIWSEKSKRFIGSDALIGGYRQVRLSTAGQAVTMKVHTVVKISFHGPTPQGYVIDHIDRDPLNNRLDNLRFATRSENALNVDARKSSVGFSVLQQPINGGSLHRWDSVLAVATSLQVNAETVKNWCRAYPKPARGFVWEYDKRDMVGEEWREITVNKVKVGVSSIGRVKQWLGMPSYGHVNRNGYATASIGERTYQIHRLVCEAFHGPSPNPDMVVNHKDECKTSNRADNLEWVTVQENNAYSRARAVRQLTLMGDHFRDYPSAREAADDTRISYTQILQCCNGSTKTAGGYQWQFQVLSPKVPTGIIRNAKSVERLNMDGTLSASYPSMTAAARENNLQQANLSKCCNGERPFAGGYRWRFKAK
jgi:hypothetical protein